MNPSDRYISSIQNNDYKNWLLLAKGKTLKNSSLPVELTDPIILEGAHLCQAWFDAYGAPVQVLIDQDLLESGKCNDLWQNCINSKRNILIGKLATSLVQVKNGLGLFFIVNRPQSLLPEELKNNSMALDQVQDPGNLGTLLRTAAAAGIKDVFLSAGCAKAWSAKVLLSAQGAHFALNIVENIDLFNLKEKYKPPLACTTLELANNLYSTDLRPKCIWIFGNEGQGVDERLQAECDLRIRIPQSDLVESLNVAAAAAVCLFEQKRQQTL